jgi:hypothetical protein
MVTKDVFVVFESLMKNQCKGKPCNFLPFKPLPPIFFPNFLICFVHFHVGSKFVVLSVLIRIGEALVQKLEIRFLAPGVMDVLGIVYPRH